MRVSFDETTLLADGPNGEPAGEEAPAAAPLFTANSVDTDGSGGSTGMHRSAREPTKVRRTDYRAMLQASGWYSSVPAARMRMLLQGKKVVAVMMAALITSLFLPDAWVISGSSSSAELDVVLTLVLFLFTMEVVALSASDASYVFSFFHFMDILGTVSMVFDISFLLGEDAAEPHMKSVTSSTEWRVLLVKALASGRVGLRAGRLSRLLRIFRFLPCMVSPDEKASGIAVVISGQLANLLATRVACLTIILVMVMPMFDILSFPQNDYSLQTWVERASMLVREGDVEGTLEELNKMAEFFSHRKYGPYTACQGYSDSDEAFVCEKHLVEWQPLFSEPARKASAMLVHSDRLLVGFNMHQPTMHQSALNMLNMFLVVFIMVFSGLALSSVVTELAVRPLERMLTTVRQIATTVFRFGDNEDREEDERDINSTSEMILLEKVVEKLATIASLHAKEEALPTTEDMQDEDLAVLSMMKGKVILRGSSKLMDGGRGRTTASSAGAGRTTRQKKEQAAQAAPRVKAPIPSVSLSDVGVSEEVFESWALNTLALTDSQRWALAVYTVSNFHTASDGEGFVRTPEDEETLRHFVTAAEQEYPANPFHNFAHAVDVVQGVAKILQLTCSDLFLSELEQYALLIAAVAHDIGHPGVNNGFLSEVGHELALQYNDRSPLENMHCARLYSIVANRETNVFAQLTKVQYKEVRKQCIETILHTDMMGHQAMVKDLHMTYQMNSEVFTPSRRGTRRSTIYKSVMGTEVDVFTQPDVKVLVMDTILHSADVSNPCRMWDVTQAWAAMCLEEFFAQGDQEKELGLPVQFLNDREKLDRANSQIGFIEFMIAPFFAAQIRLWPALRELGDNLSHNISCWEDLWVQQSGPSEEEKEKVGARVMKVNDSVKAAALRAPP